MWDRREEESLYQIDHAAKHQQKDEPQAGTSDQGQTQTRTKWSQGQSHQSASYEGRHDGLKRFGLPAEQWQRQVQQIHGHAPHHQGKGKAEADNEGPTHKQCKSILTAHGLHTSPITKHSLSPVTDRASTVFK
jgi:hypothetical protein